MPKYVFNKIFLELRYNNALFFNDMSRIQSIIDECVDIFPDNTFEPNQKVLVLNNLEKSCISNISSNRIIIDMDRPSNFEEFKIIAEKLIRVNINNLNIKKLSRIGMRTLRGIPKKNLGEANNYVKKNLFKCDDVYLNKLGNNVSNLGITFSFTNDKYKTMLNIKSASMQTFEINVNPVNVNEIKINSMTKSQSVDEVLIDSDIFQEGIIDVDFIIENFINDVIEINDCKIDEFIKNVSIQ